MNFIIEENVINGNGRLGGGALNLAGLQDSLIQNNLLYGNFAHGIAQWDNDNPFDRAAVTPGPSRPEEVAGPASLPVWGCHGNVIRNNTVLMANPARAAFQAIHGSWGSVVYNNVLINDAPTSFEVVQHRHLPARRRLQRAQRGRVHPRRRRARARSPWRSRTARDRRRASPGSASPPRCAATARRPWVLIEGHWWRENPDRPDFHPLPGSALLAGRGDAAQLPALDLDGAPRHRADIGALEAR